jgi:delta(3,5)-delta(2,4)-dienoyl-CoA isomerase
MPACHLTALWFLFSGVDLITAADVRLCSSTALFSVREVAVGLCADVGTLQRLPKVVGGQSWVRDVCLTGRNFGADEARKEGLVSNVFASKDVCINSEKKRKQKRKKKPTNQPTNQPVT